MSRAIETLHVCWREQGPCDSQFPPQPRSATWWVGVKGVISSSLSVTAVASLFFTECTLDLHLSLPIPPLVFYWVVHHFIDLWASSTDLGHSYLLGYVGCNHPACLRLHLSCGFVDSAVCLAGILNFALPSPACLPLHDLCPWCL